METEEHLSMWWYREVFSSTGQKQPRFLLSNRASRSCGGIAQASLMKK
jgi:hypothetical protein